MNNYYASDVSLNGSSMNFSSILYDCHNCNKGYGNPNPKYWLRKGQQIHYIIIGLMLICLNTIQIIQRLS